MLNQSAPARVHDDVSLEVSEILEKALDDALSRLTELDAHYEAERASLESWSGPDRLKPRLRRDLDRRHRREREPLVQHLAALHQRITSLTLFRTLH